MVTKHALEDGAQIRRLGEAAVLETLGREARPSRENAPALRRRSGRRPCSLSLRPIRSDGGPNSLATRIAVSGHTPARPSASTDSTPSSAKRRRASRNCGARLAGVTIEAVKIEGGKPGAVRCSEKGCGGPRRFQASAPKPPGLECANRRVHRQITRRRPDRERARHREAARLSQPVSLGGAPLSKAICASSCERPR